MVMRDQINLNCEKVRGALINPWLCALNKYFFNVYLLNQRDFFQKFYFVRFCLASRVLALLYLSLSCASESLRLAKGVVRSSSCRSAAGRWTYDPRKFYGSSTCRSAAHLWSPQPCHQQLRRRQHHDEITWHVRHPHPPDIASYSQPLTIFINAALLLPRPLTPPHFLAVYHVLS